MRYQEIVDQHIGEAAGVGKIERFNTTADVKPGETQRQAKKFGNKIDKDGSPPPIWNSPRLAGQIKEETSGQERKQMEPTKLYHTTSRYAAGEIMSSSTIKPSSPNSFVSLSTIPYTGDIRHNEVTLEITLSKNAWDKVIPVEYTEEWFDNHPEQASYIAGEGWREQFTIPDECFDEDYEDEDCVEQAWREAELDAFLSKSEENEVISKIPGQPIKFVQAKVFQQHKR